jgi:hypothetical protein
MTKKRAGEWPKGLMAAVRQAVETTLPSEEEVRRSVEAIDTVMAFLQDLRNRLVHQPPPVRRDDVEKALVVLEGFLEANRGRVLFGASPKVRPSSSTQPELSAILSELHALPLDDVRARLLDETRYSRAILLAIARDLRLRVDPKASRNQLADDIFKRGFANARSYDGLRGTPHLPDSGASRSTSATGGAEDGARDESASESTPESDRLP